jgi:hypothetical protein
MGTGGLFPGVKRGGRTGEGMMDFVYEISLSYFVDFFNIP